MTRLFLLLLLASICAGALAAAEKANTVLIHPGETYYARFQEKGKKLRLQSATKEKDGNAQLVISLSAKDKQGETILKLESAFSKDLIYKATIHSNVIQRHMPLPVYPIVGGKMGTVNLPPLVDEVALFDFQFDPAILVETEKDH